MSARMGGSLIAMHDIEQHNNIDTNSGVQRLVPETAALPSAVNITRTDVSGSGLGRVNTVVYLDSYDHCTFNLQAESAGKP